MIGAHFFKKIIIWLKIFWIGFSLIPMIVIFREGFRIHVEPELHILMTTVMFYLAFPLGWVGMMAVYLLGSVFPGLLENATIYQILGEWILYVLIGYWQWFILLPMIVKRICKCFQEPSSKQF